MFAKMKPDVCCVMSDAVHQLKSIEQNEEAKQSSFPPRQPLVRALVSVGWGHKARQRNLVASTLPYTSSKVERVESVKSGE